MSRSRIPRFRADRTNLRLGWLAESCAGIGLAAYIAAHDLSLDRIDNRLDLAAARRHLTLVFSERCNEAADFFGGHTREAREGLFAGNLLNAASRDVDIARHRKVRGALGNRGGLPTGFHGVRGQD